jgi:hypothetical protein
MSEKAREVGPDAKKRKRKGGKYENGFPSSLLLFFFIY